MATTDYLINDVALYFSKEKEATFNTASSTGSDYLKVTTSNPAFILPNYEITTDAGKPGNGHEFPTYQCITYVTHPAISITDQMNPFIGGRLALRALGGTITSSNPNGTTYKHTNKLLPVASGRQLPGTSAALLLGGASFKFHGMVVDRFRLSQTGAEVPQYQCDLVGTGKFTNPHGLSGLPTSTTDLQCLDGNQSVVSWTSSDGAETLTNTANFNLRSWFVEIANNTKLNDRQAGDSELSLTYQGVTETPAYVSRLRRGSRVITAAVQIALDSTIAEWERYTVGEELTDVTFKAQGAVISGGVRYGITFILGSARIASVETGTDDDIATVTLNLQAFWDTDTAIVCEVYNTDTTAS